MKEHTKANIFGVMWLVLAFTFTGYEIWSAVASILCGVWVTSANILHKLEDVEKSIKEKNNEKDI
jgi:hypothetical protein